MSFYKRVALGIRLRASLGSFDALILACTHYSLVRDSFERVLGSSLAIFDPAEAVAERVERRLWPREAGDGKTTFVIAKDSEPFRGFVGQLFPESAYTIEVLK